MSDEKTPDTSIEDLTPTDDAPPADVTGDASGEDAGAAPAQYGVGPFSVREVALLGVWVVAFIVSFFSLYVESELSAFFGLGATVWTSGLDWILTIGAPTVAVFLIVLRRFSPDGIRRVGSLGVDQFASVAFSVSALVWFAMLWTNVARAAQTGLWLNSWVVWVEFFFMVAGVFLTVLAPFIAPFDEDFRHRPEAAAHRNARPVRAIVARPVVERPVAAEPVASPYEDAAPYAAQDQTSPFAYIADDGEPAVASAAEPAVETAPMANQAFWALAPVERDVVDETGAPVFRIGPHAWALVIEDRGDSFVVRHEDGRVGYLTDISGVTRG